MKILLIHNSYKQYGGEDAAVEQEIRLFEKYGHLVYFYHKHNNAIENYPIWRKSLLFFEATWSFESYSEIRKIIREFKPDIVRVHNFFPLISPSIYYACKRENIPVIQTLHNFRLICPNALLFRKGNICEDCSKYSLWRGIIYKCYRNSHSYTAAVALMLKIHRIFKTWFEKIDAFIAISEFSRYKFIENGIPEKKIFVSPNFLETDPGVGSENRKYALFVGRLSVEKGIDILLKAWTALPDIPLKIVGEGPMRSWVEQYIKNNSLKNIELIGFVKGLDIYKYYKESMFVILPFTCYESAVPRVVIEAYATGTPVIASRIGSVREGIIENQTGLLFEPGDPVDLSNKVRQALRQPEKLKYWGQQARYEFEQKYSAERAYERLMAIYKQVLQNRKI